MAELSAEQNIRVLQAAAEWLTLLIRGTQRRQGKPCPLDEYAPDVVRYHLAHWAELQAASSGVSASGASPISGGGTRDRMKLVTIKADLELATDKAFTNGRYLMWRAVHRIYRRQDRETYILARRRELAIWVRSGGTVHPEPEPWGPLAEARCIELIARELGWFPHESCEVA